jgi:POT family proton-dependent oligopeptide transporter
MVSITCLEFSYTQAPKTMKSFVMAFYFLSVAMGNLFTSAVNFFIQNDDGTSKLAGAHYFWFFTGLMLINSVLFLFVSKRYHEEK